MALTGVKVIPKGERPQYMDWDLYKYSGDITTFNLYEQNWTDLVAEGFDKYFEDEADFELKRAEAYATEI